MSENEVDKDIKKLIEQFKIGKPPYKEIKLYDKPYSNLPKQLVNPELIQKCLFSILSNIKTPKVLGSLYSNHPKREKWYAYLKKKHNNLMNNIDNLSPEEIDNSKDRLIIEGHYHE